MPAGVGKSSIRIAIIGDVHGDWDSVEDGEALRSLDCDAAVFVGDFNEGQNRVFLLI